MHQITISVPPMFLPAVDELVRLSQSGNREQWLTQVVRGIVFDYQMRKDFAPQQQARVQQLNAFWPGPGVAPSFGSPSP